MISYETNRTVVQCRGDIAVAGFHVEGPEDVIRLSDDYGQREPGEDFKPGDYAPVPLGECSGVIIVIHDARSARTIERAARLAAESLERKVAAEETP